MFDLDSWIEAPLAHDGQGRAEVGLAPVRVSPSLQEQPCTVPVLVDQRYKQWSLGLRFSNNAEWLYFN